MAFFTEIGKKYNVTGVMGGWDNYTPANQNDQHARGESTGTAVLQLKGKQIEVTSHEHRVEEGYPANQGGPFAPYEVVKVKEVGGDGTEYYAWVVYNGDINVEEIVEQEDPPDPPDPIEEPDPPDPIDDPDLPVDPPKPDEDIITNGTEVHVKAGETVVLCLTERNHQEVISDIEYPPYKVVILIEDYDGERLDIDTHVLFIGNDRSEKVIEIENGIGGSDDLIDQDYVIVIENQPTKQEDQYEDTVSAEDLNSANKLDLVRFTNMRYIRPGWIYRLEGTDPKNTWLFDRIRYSYKWPTVNDKGLDYYKGVYPIDKVPSLPPMSSPAMFLGYIEPGTLFRVDQVLYYAPKQVQNTGRRPPFLACKLTLPGFENKEVFAWICHDTNTDPREANIKASILKENVKIGGRTIIKINIQKTDFLYGKKEGIAVKKVKTERIPSILEIDWFFPPRSSRNAREVFYKFSDGNVKKLLGINFNSEIDVSFTVRLEKKILPGQEVPFSITFEKYRIEENEQISSLFRNFKLTNRSSEDLGNGLYKLTIKNDELLKIFSELQLKDHEHSIRISTKTTNGVFNSRHHALPISQKVLFYLPGVFGSRLEVNYPTNSDNMEECWPETGINLSLLSCDERGSWRFPAKSQMLEEITFLNVNVCEAHHRVNEIKEDNNGHLFAPIFLNEECSADEKLDFVLYKEIAYDWRLSFSQYNPSANEKPLTDHEKEFPFLAFIGRKIAEVYNELIQNSYFPCSKFTLVGHSTGGIVIQGLVSLNSIIKDQVEKVFYMNVPFWGAPKAEVLLLTGYESFFGLNLYADREILRQIGPNIPISYFLAPKGRYSDDSNIKWDSLSKKGRYLKAAKNGLYNLFPTDLEGLNSADRASLMFNDFIEEKVNAYDSLLRQNYPRNLPSFIFHGKDRPTIIGTKFVADGSRFNESILYSNPQYENLIESVISGEIPSELINEFGLDSDARLSVIQEKEAWQIFDKNLFLQNILLVLRTTENRSLMVTRVLMRNQLEITDQGIKIWESSLINEMMADIGDGTVPSTSQLGLWYDHFDKEVKCFTPTPQNPEHLKAPNDNWTWEKIISTVMGQSSDYYSPLPLSSTLHDEILEGFEWEEEEMDLVGNMIEPLPTPVPPPYREKSSSDILGNALSDPNSGVNNLYMIFDQQNSSHPEFRLVISDSDASWKLFIQHAETGNEYECTKYEINQPEGCRYHLEVGFRANNNFNTHLYELDRRLRLFENASGTPVSRLYKTGYEKWREGEYNNRAKLPPRWEFRIERTIGKKVENWSAVIDIKGRPVETWGGWPDGIASCANTQLGNEYRAVVDNGSNTIFIPPSDLNEWPQDESTQERYPGKLEGSEVTHKQNQNPYYLGINNFFIARFQIGLLDRSPSEVFIEVAEQSPPTNYDTLTVKIKPHKDEHDTWYEMKLMGLIKVPRQNQSVFLWRFRGHDIFREIEGIGYDILIEDRTLIGETKYKDNDLQVALTDRYLINRFNGVLIESVDNKNWYSVEREHPKTKILEKIDISANQTGADLLDVVSFSQNRDLPQIRWLFLIDYSGSMTITDAPASQNRLTIQNNTMSSVLDNFSNRQNHDIGCRAFYQRIPTESTPNTILSPNKIGWGLDNIRNNILNNTSLYPRAQTQLTPLAMAIENISRDLEDRSQTAIADRNFAIVITDGGDETMNSSGDRITTNIVPPLVQVLSQTNNRTRVRTLFLISIDVDLSTQVNNANNTLIRNGVLGRVNYLPLANFNQLLPSLNRIINRYEPSHSEIGVGCPDFTHSDLDFLTD